MSSQAIQSCDGAIQSVQTQSLQHGPLEVLEHHCLQEIIFLFVYVLVLCKSFLQLLLTQEIHNATEICTCIYTKEVMYGVPSMKWQASSIAL